MRGNMQSHLVQRAWQARRRRAKAPWRWRWHARSQGRARARACTDSRISDRSAPGGSRASRAPMWAAQGKAYCCKKLVCTPNLACRRRKSATEKNYPSAKESRRNGKQTETWTSRQSFHLVHTGKDPHNFVQLRRVVRRHGNVWSPPLPKTGSVESSVC